MDSPLLVSLTKLSIREFLILAPMGVVIGYLFLSNRVSLQMFILVLSAALVGIAIPVIDGTASLVRWLSILILLLTGILFGRMKISYGFLLFWGYVFFGFIFIFRATYFTWQMQRGFLLLMVAIAIPAAFSNKAYPIFRSTLLWIGFVGVIFAALNFMTLPSRLNSALRFVGYAKIAPFLACTLGGLIPFTFWGYGYANTKVLKIIYGLGFLSGILILLISGQRAGTITGIVGLLPLLFTYMTSKKNIGRSMLLVILLGLAIAFLFFQSSTDRITFLLSRYSLAAGLSNRDIIWQSAITEISKNPFLGQGIGAAEGIVSASFHNAYLEVWYNTGSIGLLLYLAAQIYFFSRVFRLYWSVSDPERKSVAALAFGYMCGFSLMGVFESLGAGASNMNLILYLFLGVLVSTNILCSKEPNNTVPASTLSNRHLQTPTPATVSIREL